MKNRIELLQQYFGHNSLKEGQELIIARVLAGENTFGILPTGGGKSLCYQLPALVLSGVTVVVSPLIALMRDQVHTLVERGVPAARVDSTSSEEEKLEILESAQSGELKLLYVSPERFVEPRMILFLKGVNISLLAIDEAHCVSEWGHSFRSSYIQLPRVVKSVKPECVLALTATASPRTAQGIRQAFSILKKNQIQTSFYRSNLSFHVSACSTEEKEQRLLSLLSDEARVPAIVYATRRNDVEALAALLNKAGLKARAYHAGMPADARAEVQDGFAEHRFDIICATIAFGMGVDMPDVRSVVHYHPPKSPEGWIQESGRAGRDGGESHCEVFLNADDRADIEGMVQAKRPSRHAVYAILQNIFSQRSRAIISRYQLSTENDMAAELLDILLARLETGGWVSRDGASWMWCHLVPLRWDAGARKRALYGFPKKQQEVFTEMLSSRQRTNLYDLVGGDVLKMNKLVGQLRELESGGDVKLKMSHSLIHYKIKKVPESIESLASEMLGVFEEHCGYDMKRVEAVFKMAGSRKCLAVSLVGYFGEKLIQPCGKCSACLGRVIPRGLPERKAEEVSLEELQAIQVLVSERRSALSSSERLARFLCGIYSPAMMRYRLYNHPSWGMLDRLPYDDVLACARAQQV